MLGRDGYRREEQQGKNENNYRPGDEKKTLEQKLASQLAAELSRRGLPPV
jgi:hypothetical protein